MRIFIDMGHCTAQGTADTGAGYNGHREELLNRQIAYTLIPMLEALGHEVKFLDLEYSETRSESLRVRRAAINAYNPNISISIHLNSFPTPNVGYGSEILTTGNKFADSLATNILKEFESLGLRNRGIKDGTGFALVSVNCPAMIIECCFINNDYDMSKYEPLKFAQAICKGLTGKLPEEKQPEPEIPQEPQTPINETVQKEYNEVGKFTANYKIYFRNNPLVHASNPITGYYDAGENVIYDKVVITNRYVYISWWSTSAKTRRYMPIRERINGVSQEMWGTIE